MAPMFEAGLAVDWTLTAFRLRFPLMSGSGFAFLPGSGGKAFA
jgi:hypothetical protein